VSQLDTDGLLPGIAFIFSRKQVEVAAHELKLNLTDGEENFEHRVEQECIFAMKRLPDWKRYTSLPEYEQLVGLLKRGIAIHHAGMVPVFRELVEILFGKGMIKFLFATETFAVGINMPTKTVIFTSLEKFDGSGMRPLLPHEYTQMAGRAGRRGIDTEGHVIHCANLYGDKLDQNFIDSLVSGRAQTLESKFSLSYNLVLNMLSGEAITPDGDYRIPITQQTMLRADVERELAQVEGEIREIETKLGSMCCCCGIPNEILEQYHAAVTMKTANNKARKKAQRDAASIRDQHHRLDADYTRFLERRTLSEELKVKNMERSNIKEYFESQKASSKSLAIVSNSQKQELLPRRFKKDLGT
jgi:antiviral helicase SKI2